MIEIGEARRGDQTLEAAGTWAMDTLLSLGHTAEPPSEGALRESAALQKLQALTFATACLPSATSGDATISWLLPWLDDDNGGSTMDPIAAVAVLELVATLIASDDEFLDAAEALLGKIDCVSLGNAFLDRIFRAPARDDTSAGVVNGSQGCTLFDMMSLQSKIRVWGNHLPSWRRQLQQWLLAAHREPFRSIGSILAFHSPLVSKKGISKNTSVRAWAAAFQQYSHLYVTLVGWSHEHAALLGSCRSIELVGTLAVFTRPPLSTSVFNRSIVDKSWTANPAFWTFRHRVQRFIALDESLKRHELECVRLPAAEGSSKALAEWIGAAERPHLVLEALEMLFHSEGDRNSLLSDSRTKTESLVATASTGATLFLGWFYSHILSTGSSTPSATAMPTTEEVTAVATSIRANLKVSDLESGARWLQSNRAAFATFSIFRLRLVWFWLLKCVHDSISDKTAGRHDELGDDDDDERRSALVTGILETIEYAFRRFAPSDRKRYDRRPSWMGYINCSDAD